VSLATGRVAGLLTPAFAAIIIKVLIRKRWPGYAGRTAMIKKLLIIGVLAGIAYGVYYGLNQSDFFGTRGKERKTFEDVESSLFDE